MFISEFSSINLRNSSKLQNDQKSHFQTQLQCPPLTIEVKGKCVRSPTKSSPSFAIYENSSVKQKNVLNFCKLMVLVLAIGWTWKKGLSQ